MPLKSAVPTAMAGSLHSNFAGDENGRVTCQAHLWWVGQKFIKLRRIPYDAGLFQVSGHRQ
jgi:hypothetical protein